MAQPLRDRLQNRVQDEAERKAAEARTQIEQQLAARPSPAEMAQVGQVQTALNFFTFDAGSVDGLMGQQTRSAIEDYQAYLDYPVTGQLAEAEAQFLMVSYQQAQANSAQAQQVAATHPDGIKGLLVIFRDGAPAQPTGVIPGFLTAGDQQDLAAFCAEPAAAAASAAPGTSIDQTLGPLFCSATDAALAHSEALAANVAGFTPDEIEAQCMGFAPALVSIVASVSEGPASDVIAGAAGFVERTGQDPIALAGIAKVCLGVGYGRDQLDLAIGSAVLLTALDELTYSEFTGYHLALGFGVDRDPTLARSWFEVAMQNDGEPQSDFEAQAADRMAALQAALAQSGAEGAPGAVAMPSFSASE
ncbi:MAG: peptidoglycan-binding domain-containing protein [Pseudomonadota bacterium]